MKKNIVGFIRAKGIFFFIIAIFAWGIAISANAIDENGITNTYGVEKSETLILRNAHESVVLNSYPQANEKVGTLKWEYKTGGYIRYCPAIGSDRTIYAGSDDGYLYALNPNGTLKWKYEVGYSVDTSPAIGSDDTIYIGGARYEEWPSSYSAIFALNPNGSLKWEYRDNGNISISSGSSFAIDSNGVIYIPSGKFLYALNPDGTPKWKYEVKGDLPAIYGSPTVGTNGTIYFGADENWWSNINYFYAVNPDGTFKWKYKTAGTVSAPPAIGSDGTIYFGTHDGYLYALNPNGTLKWKYNSTERDPSVSPYTPKGHIWTSPVIGNGTIYVIYSYTHISGTNTRSLLALNLNGTFKWRTSGIEGVPAIVSNGTIYAPGAGVFLALNLNGSTKWEHHVTGVYFSDPTIDVDGTIYTSGTDGYLRAIYGSGSLANAPWPKIYHDIKNTGRADSDVLSSRN